ncbi:MAG: 16S rRNA (cytosine(967)-C(5))-methyltransferase RsmB [Syntrophomonadaceae bacterium]|nr:16S rRNA (cytosine(967)-C(5))-methyltransferase RsmB [Syntrophomonadaceae bacterium]
MNKKKTVISPARETALNILFKVCEQGAYANITLEKQMRNSDLSLEDRNLITEMVNGTIRMRKHLDWVLALFIKGDMNKQNPWLRNILRISAYQLLFMDKIAEYACVDDAVELTRKKAGSGLTSVTNGVLRNIIRNRDRISFPQDTIADLCSYYSHPEWMGELFISQFGERTTKDLFIYNNKRPGLVIRTNSLKISRPDLLDKLRQEEVICHAGDNTPWGIVIESLPVPIDKLKSFQEGEFYIQNEASMLAAAIINAQKNELIYDLCSGIGGKTTHLGECMKNQGQILAVDIYSRKLSLLKDNCLRLGITNVKTVVADILELETDLKADKVLLDAPCSGLGVLNRRSDSRWNKKSEDIKELSQLQSAMLNKAANLVTIGGYIMYSTCTIIEEENTHVIESFLEQNANFIAVDFESQIKFFPLDEIDTAQARQGMLTIIPGKYDTDGMFYALLRRIA